jgi:hypothetical protein
MGVTRARAFTGARAFTPGDPKDVPLGASLPEDGPVDAGEARRVKDSVSPAERGFRDGYAARKCPPAKGNSHVAPAVAVAVQVEVKELGVLVQAAQSVVEELVPDAAVARA